MKHEMYVNFSRVPGHGTFSRVQRNKYFTGIVDGWTES